MAALVEALDHSSSYLMQYGEKGHAEYRWSPDVQESLLQIHFQLARCDESKQKVIIEKMQHILLQLQTTISIGRYQELMITAYKMIGHTRDIINGKGEYTLGYALIMAWYPYFPELAKYALRSFVQSEDNNIKEHPYGSWKDIKYFCQYVRNYGYPASYSLIYYAQSLMIEELKRIEATGIQTNLIAKWVPREKSKKFGWLFDQLAQMYFENYLKTATTPEKKKRAFLKAKMHFRQLLAKWNRQLDTVQIKQCEQQWAQIDHSKTTSITLQKQKHAFLNITESGNPRSGKEDRKTCATNFQSFVEDAIRSEREIKGKRILLTHFTKDAMYLLERKKRERDQNNQTLDTEFALLNSQWRDNARQTPLLGSMIAMLDLSSSMIQNENSQPYYAAIALACRIAEKSMLGKRILTFSNQPRWHNLNLCKNFTDMVETLQTVVEQGCSTNFYRALDLILEAIVQNKMTAEQTEGMTLVILSDMQINMASSYQSPYESSLEVEELESLYQMIEKKYAETGMRICDRPYKPPHILFWNLRSTNGFPCLSRQKNVSMMSGFSPSLLNIFYERGLEGLQSVTPWTLLHESLGHVRYQCLEDKIKIELGFV